MLDARFVATEIFTAFLFQFDWKSIVLRGLLLILVTVLSIVVIIFISRRRAIHKYQTPYDFIERRIRDSNNSTEWVDKPYDIFVSYKSEDAMKIRPLVEQMLASDVKVWFAEYNIRLEGREAFEHAITRGIANSKYGLCFTNNQYITSQYCWDELDKLLAPENCGAKHVIEIGFPSEPLPHQRYPQLEALTMISYEDDLNRLIGQINQITGFRIDPALQKSLKPPVYRNFDYGKKSYQLDLTNWTLISEGAPVGGDGEAVGPVYERMCGEYQIRGYLHIGTDIAFPRAQHRGDDRENYEYGINFARVHYSYLPMQCIGVHLFFHHGFSQIALTARGTLGWCRSYSVIIPMPGTGLMVEFFFDFYIRSPFREFCRYAHHMDRVVQSFAWL